MPALVTVGVQVSLLELSFCSCRCDQSLGSSCRNLIAQLRRNFTRRDLGGTCLPDVSTPRSLQALKFSGVVVQYADKAESSTAVCKQSLASPKT